MEQNKKRKYILNPFGRKEKYQVEPLYNSIGDEILKARIKNCLEWYIEDAAKYKMMCKILGIIGIILPLVITVINSWRPVNLNTDLRANLITVLSAVTSFIASLQAFLALQEKWILYRSTAEEIKRELTLYHAGVLNNDALYQFTVKIEQVMAQEKEEWLRLANKLKENSNNQK